MEQIKEAVYLINDERYLHLRENGAGVGFATYNKVTGEPLESGQISEKNLPPDGQNTIPAARNWYLFELSDDDRKAIQQESVKILENIPQAGIGRRRIWEPETLPKDIRLMLLSLRPIQTGNTFTITSFTTPLHWTAPGNSGIFCCPGLRYSV